MDKDSEPNEMTIYLLSLWIYEDSGRQRRIWPPVRWRPGPPAALRRTLTALHSETPAVWFLVPPTVSTLSLSLHTATSGGGGVTGRGSKGKDTRTPLVTYDLLKPRHPQPLHTPAIRVYESALGRRLRLSTSFGLAHRRRAVCVFSVTRWRDTDALNTMLRL